MPRKHKRNLGARQYKNYDNEKLIQYLEYIKQKQMTQRAASEFYKIPRRTINYKLKELHLQKPGRPTVLTQEEERMIQDCIIQVGEYGFPVDKLELRMIVKSYLDRQGRDVPQFKENMPGEEWVNLNLERHNEISTRLAAHIKKSRAKTDEEILSNYIKNLSEVVKDVPPENIWNYDETCLTDDTGQKKVIIRKGTKYPERIINASKANISVMFAGSAAGELMPPYVVYKSTHLWNTWTNGGPRGIRYNNTKCGWFDSLTFLEWFESMMLPKLEKQVGKSSHLSSEVIAKCKENNVYFVCLPSGTTHLTILS